MIAVHRIEPAAPEDPYWNRVAILRVSVEELIGEPPSAAARKRGAEPALQRHTERISALPKAQQKSVLQVLESVLHQGR